MSTITVKHNGYQCPWLSKTISMLECFCSKSDCKYEIIDISNILNANDLLYGFPFAVYVDDRYVTNSPLFSQNISDLFVKKCNKLRLVGVELKDGEVITHSEIQKENINKSIAVCQNGNMMCKEKEEWFRMNMDKMIGFVGYDLEKPVVMLEMEKVELNNNALRILCFYSNHENFDYKYDLLKKCTVAMKENGFLEIFVYVGEYDYYPNGTKSQFEKMGFNAIKKIGETYLLDRGYDNIYLMKKTL